MSSLLNIKTITQYYRILGLPLEASLDDCRRSRNRLLQKFHPDKQPQQWATNLHSEDRIHLIQEAYNYIREHYLEIQVFLKPVEDDHLTSKMPKGSKSHWVYTQVQKLSD